VESSPGQLQIPQQTADHAASTAFTQAATSCPAAMASISALQALWLIVAFCGRT